jgi:citrate lyase subunit beta/citryl-CoA lyase
VNAGLFGADCLVLDLEDSVAPSRKAEARILVRRTLESCRSFLGEAEIVVRVNPLSGPFGRDDLAEIVPAFPQALILPKCESAADVEELDRELSRLERASGLAELSILVMPLVETARGVANAPAIAAASARAAALCFGAEDFSRDIGARRSASGAESLYVRQALVVAAKAAGIQAHDSVFSDVDDEPGLAASCAEARALGFDGKGLVHPRQIAIAHNAFDPSPAELEAAARVVAALEAAEAEGSGVASLDGKMIDAPVAARARRLLAGGAKGRP